MLPLNLSIRLTHLPVILLVLSVLVVQGCFHSSSGGGGSTGPTNAAPVFTSGTAINVGADTTVTGYTATATDADGDTLTFSLSGGTDDTAFSIDSDSGALSFAITTNFDTPADSDEDNSYVVDITATDGTASVVQTVTVTVIYTIPVFTSGTAISVGAGTPVTGYTATATDVDGDTVTFSLSGGTDQVAFSIDSDSGVLSFSITTDFDAPADSDGNNRYVVDITATDGTTPIVQTVTVTVIDDANPVGYYTNTGTASVSDGMSGTIDINDLQAMVNGDRTMVNGDRIMMMSVANKLLYDGTITNINGNDFTVDFTIYTDGENPVSATASGTITEGSTIEGTLVGSGAGSGTFSLLYATMNDAVADISRIENVVGVNRAWIALIGDSVVEQEFIINNMGAIMHDASGGPGIFSGCDFNGTITPITNSSLYAVTVILTECNTGGGIANGTYTGLTTSRTDSAEDDTLVFAVTNGEYSPNADFE